MVGLVALGKRRTAVIRHSGPPTINWRLRILQAHSKLKAFFVHQLHDIFRAEKKMVKTLEKLKEAATTIRLKES